jgi:hypothetical protein
VDESPQAMISARMDPNEEILWAGRPPFGVQLRPMELLYIPFFTLLAVLLMRLIAEQVRHGAALYLLVEGPLFLACLYMAGIRLFVAARQRQSMYYLVTTKHIIIASDFIRRRVKVVRLRRIWKFWLRERRDGSGRVQFEPAPLFGAQMYMYGAQHSNWLNVWGIPSWWQIEVASGARQVYEIVEAARERAKYEIVEAARQRVKSDDELETLRKKRYRRSLAVLAICAVIGWVGFALMMFQAVGHRPEQQLNDAIQHRDLRAVQATLDAHPDLLNVRSGRRYTPLMEAVQAGDIRIVELLIKRGADVTPQGPDGKTALDLAVEHKNMPLAVLLGQHGGRLTVH